MADSFFRSVYEVVARIPYGKVVSYGDVAKAVGYPNRARFVGFAMRVCPEELPWHRVVMADGSIAGGEWTPIRRMLLEREGVPFLPDGRVDMNACRAALGADCRKSV
jgi:methylated-DNA-protein-cysteine methyltransferase-like protein